MSFLAFQCFQRSLELLYGLLAHIRFFSIELVVNATNKHLGKGTGGK